MSDATRGMSSEGAEQAAVVEWCELVGVPVIHVPNEEQDERLAAALHMLICDNPKMFE